MKKSVGAGWFVKVMSSVKVTQSSCFERFLAHSRFPHRLGLASRLRLLRCRDVQWREGEESVKRGEKKKADCECSILVRPARAGSRCILLAVGIQVFSGHFLEALHLRGKML